MKTKTTKNKYPACEMSFSLEYNKPSHWCDFYVDPRDGYDAYCTIESGIGSSCVEQKKEGEFGNWSYTTIVTNNKCPFKKYDQIILEVEK